MAGRSKAPPYVVEARAKVRQSIEELVHAPMIARARGADDWPAGMRTITWPRPRLTLCP